MTDSTVRKISGKPFSGLRVIDFTHVLAGPACSDYFSLLGADVIKVETIGRGDGMRVRGGTDKARAQAGLSTAFLTQGGGKRSLAINLSDERGYDIMTRLLRSSDVLVENHRPSTLKALNLDFDHVSSINPAIIHCAMTGYGRHGPKEDAPAYDVNIQASCGLMTMTGDKGTVPVRTGAPVMDYATGLAAGFAVASALYHRTQTGEGAFVDVSMFETAMTLMSSTVTDYLATGNVPQKRGNAANSRSPAAGSFPTAEGLLSLGINEEHQFRDLAELLGKPEWHQDTRFKDRVARADNTGLLEAGLIEALSKRTAAEWEEMMLANGIPAARVRTLPEALTDPQLSHRSFLHHHAGDESVAVTVPSLPFRIGDTAAHTPDRKPPRLGEHSREILAELGFEDDEIDLLVDKNVIGMSDSVT